jgi:hypothetical protein
MQASQLAPYDNDDGDGDDDDDVDDDHDYDHNDDDNQSVVVLIFRQFILGVKNEKSQCSYDLMGTCEWI